VLDKTGTLTEEGLDTVYSARKKCILRQAQENHNLQTAQYQAANNSTKATRKPELLQHYRNPGIVDPLGIGRGSDSVTRYMIL